MSFCNREEQIYDCDNFFIKINNAEIDAIGYIDSKGFYFNILSVHKNGKIYRSPKYHIKYIISVKDIIFTYYKENGLVSWL